MKTNVGNKKSHIMNSLSEKEKTGISEIVRLGVLIPGAKISLNLEVKNITVYDLKVKNGKYSDDYLFHFDAWFSGNTDKLYQCIDSLTKYISDNGLLK